MPNNAIHLGVHNTPKTTVVIYVIRTLITFCTGVLLHMYPCNSMLQDVICSNEQNDHCQIRIKGTSKRKKRPDF